ncbi:unnamed protein product [Ixodes pacificus]
MTGKRVVVTGLGLVTSLGSDVSTVWESLVGGSSGVSSISGFETFDLDCRIGSQIFLKGESEKYTLDLTGWMEERDAKKLDPFITFGVVAAGKALSDSGLLGYTYSSPDRLGVLVGSGIGGLGFIEKNITALNDRGPRRVSPFFIPGSLVNLLPGNISIKYGITGYCNAVVCACATGAVAIGEAARVIKCGDADVMLAGGSEGALCRTGVAGFCALKALSTRFNDAPSVASRPWDKDRDGFVMGDGAGVVVLEELEHAKRRGAKIYAELLGYGLSSDAHHITSPHPEGQGGASAMRRALQNAGITQQKVDYINAHGTSTVTGDSVEILAIQEVFQEHAYKIPISSTKSSIGHLLGAAGSVEAIFTILAIRSGIAPPTLNLHNSSEDDRLNLVPLLAQEHKIECGLSNSFGFGGINASLIFCAA